VTGERCGHCSIYSRGLCQSVREHPGLCCDCFDLANGESLERINERRKVNGRKPVNRWPRGKLAVTS
jgi:hypothetical protein